MAAPRPRFPALCLLVGAVLLTAALADWRLGWLVRGAERLQQGPGLSAVTLRALWLLRVWFAVAGAWCIGAAWLRTRPWPAEPLAQVRAAPWLFPACVAAGMVLWTLPLGFVGDDFLWLAAWDERGLGVLHREAGSPHYIPLGMLFCNLPHMLFGLHALPYRVVTLLLHAAVAALVGRGAATSGLRPVLAAGAGLVFAATALAYEPVLWATGQFYLWPGVITAAVLAALLRPPEELGSGVAWAAALGAAAAGFIIEQAAGLTLFVALWAAVGGGRRCAPAVRMPLIVLPVCGGLALVLLRVGTRGAADAFVGVDQVLRNVDQILGGLLVVNSPAGHMLGGWAGTHAALRWMGALLVLGGGAWWTVRAGTVGRTLLAAWVCLWLPALLFAPQTSRYWYLPAIPAAIGIVYAFAALEARCATAERPRMWPLSWAAVALWVLLGAVAMGLRVPDWRLAHRTARTVEDALAAAVRADPTVRQVVIAGVPDGVGTGLWPAYVFNNGLTEAVAYRLRADGVAWRGAVHLLPGPHRPWPRAHLRGADPGWPAAALDAAVREPDTLVFTYDPGSGGLRPRTESTW